MLYERTRQARELEDAKPQPSALNARGIPAVNALEPRVTERYNSRAGTGRWSDVTVRDAHGPTELLRPLRPGAESACVSYHLSSTGDRIMEREFAPARALPKPRAHRRTAAERKDARAELLALQQAALDAIIRATPVGGQSNYD
jgi:hypothetical protein